MWAGLLWLRDLKGSGSGGYIVEKPMQKLLEDLGMEKPMQKFVKLLGAALGNMSEGSEGRNESTCLLNIVLGKTDGFIVEPGFLGPARTDSGLTSGGSRYFLIF